MFIGSDIPEAHWIIYERIGRMREPLTTLSILGWVLSGPLRGNVNMKFQVNCMTATHSTGSRLNPMFQEL